MRFFDRTTLIVAVLLSISPLLPFPAQAAEQPPIASPWLRDQLPGEALLYVRIPTIMGLFGTPKGNALDAALRSQANAENIAKLRTGITNKLLPQLPMYTDLRILALERHLRSPIEIAVSAAPAPAALFAMTIDVTTADEFQSFIDELTMANPAIGLMGELDADGIGQLLGFGMPLYLQFEIGSGRLLMNMGPGVSPESFAALRQSMHSDGPNRMQAIESRIDDSGQGFFAWLDAENAIPAMQMFLPPSQMENIRAVGLDQVRSFAIGWGVADGKGRLSAIVDVPNDGARQILPFVQNRLSAKAVGEPDGLLVLSIPTANEFSRIESTILGSSTVGKALDWQNTKDKFREFSGVAMEEYLNALGPEVLFVFDQAGDYLAVRLRNEDLFNDLLERMTAKTGVAPDSRRISGDTYYHWSLPSLYSMADAKDMQKLGWLGAILDKQRDHLYWTIDDGFMYLASVPQILIERESRGAKTDIGKWLAEKPRIDASQSILAFTLTNEKLPQRYYAAYIEIMQWAADVADTEVDIWSMPTAEDLSLPRESAIGFALNLGDPYLSMELSFENNPFEMFIGSGFGGVAVVGVLAAIAIPAYQDYTIRAQVAEGLNLAGGAKAAITEYYFEFGAFPDAAAADELSIYEYAGKYTWSVVVEPDSGVIVIDYSTEKLADGGQLFLEPDTANGSVYWACSSTIAEKHVPAACRSN